MTSSAAHLPCYEPAHNLSALLGVVIGQSGFRPPEKHWDEFNVLEKVATSITLLTYVAYRATRSGLALVAMGYEGQAGAFIRVLVECETFTLMIDCDPVAPARADDWMYGRLSMPTSEARLRKLYSTPGLAASALAAWKAASISGAHGFLPSLMPGHLEGRSGFTPLPTRNDAYANQLLAQLALNSYGTAYGLARRTNRALDVPPQWLKPVMEELGLSASDLDFSG